MRINNSRLYTSPRLRTLYLTTECGFEASQGAATGDTNFNNIGWTDDPE